MIFQPPQHDTNSPHEYSKFWELWHEQKFFECHEVLEELWKRTETREKWFYGGLINAAVSIYQHRRGNVYGACRQLLRAQVKLHPFAPRHRGVDIEILLRSIEDEIASSLAQLSTSQRAQQPALRQSIQQRMARDFQNTSALDDRENDTHGR